MAEESLRIVFAERPTADIIPGKTLVEEKVRTPTADDLKDGEILVQNLYLSLDPAMRGWMNDRRSYTAPLKLGDTMRGFSVARVLASKSSQAEAGDHVTTYRSGWQEIGIVKEGGFEPASTLPKTSHLTDYLAVLGFTGITAYIGITKFGEIKEGDVVVVSGAAGATGSVAGQIAKILGARVIGIAGSDDKAKWIQDDLGFDVGLNYKDPDFRKKFKEATKDFIDVYFDNVGGDILELALSQAKPFARFVECGMISLYNNPNPVGPKTITNIVTMRIKMQGFLVTDHAKDFVAARKQLLQWLEEGKIKRRETVVKGGLKVAPETLVSLYKGINTGKLIVEIKNPADVPKL